MTKILQNFLFNLVILEIFWDIGRKKNAIENPNKKGVNIGIKNLNVKIIIAAITR